jgi:acyl dehydratase
MEKNRTPLKIGDTLPVLNKTAYAHVDPQARNIIHTDDFAREFGMRGALVPGSTLLSYVLEMLYNYFGESWLHHGRIKVSFIGGGAVNGDQLKAFGMVTEIEWNAPGSRIHLDVHLENQDQKRILLGTASCL